MGLLPVDEALKRILDAASTTPAQDVALTQAAGRVLAGDLAARITQPPFDASAMDGYAVRARDVQKLPATLKLIGESAAGHAYGGTVGDGETVRIFTGAPVPAGADAIVIQENVKADGNLISVIDGEPDPGHIRKRGFDFKEGQAALLKGRRMTSRDVLLAAAMGHALISCASKPRVAILATGDELVAPGDTPRSDQIVSSNPYGLAAMVSAFGGEPQLLGIASDTLESLSEKISQAEDAEILLTIGGASVGDHDLVIPALKAAGMTLDFWKIAMRPGKPMIFGHRGNQIVLGLPGNPVSSMICARVFAIPLIARMLGRPDDATGATTSILASPIGANGPRAHYMRAHWVPQADGATAVAPIKSQDSALIAPLASADCLIVRPPGAKALVAGETVATLPLDF